MESTFVHLARTQLMRIEKPFRRGWATANFPNMPAAAPGRLPLGPLRLCAMEIFEPGFEGFTMHDHRDVEIVTLLLAGTFSHRDSVGQTTKLPSDGVQAMSAGTGLSHAEFPDGDCVGVQIIMDPARRGTRPACHHGRFPRDEGRNGWITVASGRPGDGPTALPLGQDAAVRRAVIDAGNSLAFEVEPDRRAYVLVARGAVRCGPTLGIEGERFVAESGRWSLYAERAGEVIWIDLPR